MSSMSILMSGTGTPWRVEIADRAMPKGESVYQQSGPGQQKLVIHDCENRGEPFDSARHRAARSVWDALQSESKPREDKARDALVKRMNDLYWEQKD